MHSALCSTLPLPLLQTLVHIAARYDVPFDELQEVALDCYCEGMRRVASDWRERYIPLSR
jgi:hypothetical protein